MFDALIDRGIPQLRNAIGIISSVGNPAMVIMTAAGLSIQARDELGLAAELRLNGAACVSCRFQPAIPGNNYEYIFVNLAPLRQFLEQEATEEDNLFIIHNPLPNDDDQRECLTVFLLSPAGNGRHLQLEAINDQLQVPAMMVDETRYMVTSTIQSLGFRNWVEGRRYFIDANGHRTDNLRPIWFSLTALMIEIRVSLAQLRGVFFMQGAMFPLLSFDLANLEAFINATRMSEDVLVYADPVRRPLLNCPFGNGLGNLFFFGNIISNTIWWWSYYQFTIN